jgi:hypothetical protein
MKAIKSRSVLVLGGILIATLAAGCYGGGHGYYNDPYGYNSGYGSTYSSNGGYYSSNPYGGSYYSSYPNGYYSSYPNSYSYNNGYNGRSSYNSGYRNGVRADESRDRRQDRTVETEHTVATHDRASTEPSRVVRDDHSSRDSRSTHRSDIN